MIRNNKKKKNEFEETNVHYKYIDTVHSTLLRYHTCTYYVHYVMQLCMYLYRSDTSRKPKKKKNMFNERNVQCKQHIKCWTGKRCKAKVVVASNKPRNQLHMHRALARYTSILNKNYYRILSLNFLLGKFKLKPINSNGSQNFDSNFVIWSTGSWNLSKIQQIFLMHKFLFVSEETRTVYV